MKIAAVDMEDLKSKISFSNKYKPELPGGRAFDVHIIKY